jgi:hypothetical protein
MNEQHEKGSAVSLFIDYSNGVQKIFANIPWATGMAVLDVLEEARSAGPGLMFEFSGSFTDRGGRDVGTIASIDGVAGESNDEKWLFWVNRKYMGQGLRARGHPTEIGEPRVEAGDVVTFKLATGP